MDLKAVLFYNPASGRIRLTGRRLTRLIERLHAMGLSVEPVASRPRSSGPLSIDLGGRELLIVYGGDGTIHDAIPSALKWDVPLALLPAGTANVLARELEIPLNPDRALRLIRSGREVRIHLGRAGDQVFHLMVGVGLDGHVIRTTNLDLKRRIGVGAYWWAGWRAFWEFPFHKFEVEMNGTCYHTPFAVMSNARYYGGEFLVTPKAGVTEDCLDVCLFQSESRWRLLAYLVRALNGSHLQMPDLVYAKTRHIQIRPGAERIWAQIDGDLIESVPQSVELCEQQLKVLVPSAPG